MKGVNNGEVNVGNVGFMLASLFVSHGISKVFVSPGSRNAHLIGEIVKCKNLEVLFVVDERSAAFAAMGYSAVAGEPVALICTSGSAPLNYAPALSEAFYRKIPLVAVTADRPNEWIGQDDSQTIDQRNIFENYVKGSYNVPVIKDDSDAWFANRVVNEALLLALADGRGPVHINVQLGENTNEVIVPGKEYLASRSICVVESRRDLMVSEARALGNELKSPKKVLIVAGFMAPDSKLNRALSRLSKFDNFVILTETISNLHGKDFIGSIDTTLLAVKRDEIERYYPDVIITLGGALISRRIKEFLRNSQASEHWHVGKLGCTVDCFRRLTRRIELEPAIFFEQLASAMQPHRAPSDYSYKWHVACEAGKSLLQSHAAKSEWCDLKAFSRIIPLIPANWNVQYSNGTAIRYAQLFGYKSYHRCDCNRGVSGIDGCTSTAVGASLAYSLPTLLISGDTSAFYDMCALGLNFVSPNFKMIIIRNGGGGIFRFIKHTKNLEFREEYLCGDFNFPVRAVAEGFGFRYLSVFNENELVSEMKKLIDEREHPVIMEVVTPAAYSGEVLSGLLD